MEQLIELTENAKTRIIELLEIEEEKLPLRFGVKGGGCSGFMYTIDFNAEKERDNVLDFEGFQVVIDPKSTIYLKGLTVDYDGFLNGKGFVFNNPSASNSCGCGESFSI